MSPSILIFVIVIEHRHHASKDLSQHHNSHQLTLSPTSTIDHPQQNHAHHDPPPEPHCSMTHRGRTNSGLDTLCGQAAPWSIKVWPQASRPETPALAPRLSGLLSPRSMVAPHLRLRPAGPPPCIARCYNNGFSCTPPIVVWSTMLLVRMATTPPRGGS